MPAGRTVLGDPRFLRRPGRMDGSGFMIRWLHHWLPSLGPSGTRMHVDDTGSAIVRPLRTALFRRKQVARSDPLAWPLPDRSPRACQERSSGKIPISRTARPVAKPSRSVVGTSGSVAKSSRPIADAPRSIVATSRPVVSTSHAIAETSRPMAKRARSPTRADRPIVGVDRPDVGPIDLRSTPRKPSGFSAIPGCSNRSRKSPSAP